MTDGMNGGWVKLYRTIFDHKIAKRVKLSRLDCFLWLVAHAEWKDDNETTFHGTCYTTFKELSKALSRPKQTIFSWLSWMVREGMIDYEISSDEVRTGVRTEILVVYICNYSTYQGSKNGLRTGVQTTFGQAPQKNPSYNGRGCASSTDEEDEEIITKKDGMGDDHHPLTGDFDTIREEFSQFEVFVKRSGFPESRLSRHLQKWKDLGGTIEVIVSEAWEAYSWCERHNWKGKAKKKDYWSFLDNWIKRAVRQLNSPPPTSNGNSYRNGNGKTFDVDAYMKTFEQSQPSREEALSHIRSLNNFVEDN